MRAGVGNPLTAEISKKCYAYNMEKYSGTKLDNVGESLSDGQSLQVIFNNAGITGNVPGHILAFAQH